MKPFDVVAAGVLTAAVALGSDAVLAEPLRKPNIVVIMTDDVGWGDLGSYGGGAMRGAPTPNLDRLAAEGMRFVNYYGQASCTAGRASFITGRGARWLRSPAASTRPSGESRCRFSTSCGLTPCLRYASTTLSSSPVGTTFPRRRTTDRSMISATATTDAKSRNQIGQPAAWMMANTR